MILLMNGCNCLGACADEVLWPTSDVSTGTWTDATGGDNDGILSDELDEVQIPAGSADDATTYIELIAPTGGGSSYEVHLSDPVGTFADFSTGTIRMRWRTVGHLGMHTITHSLLQGATLINSQVLMGPQTTWTTSSLAVNMASITDPTDLRINVGGGSTGGVGDWNVSANWMDLACP